MMKKKTYVVNITTEGEGWVSLTTDKSEYEAGEEVILTAVVEEGYEVSEISASWSEGEIELTEVEDNKWSFLMPDGDVEIDAVSDLATGKIILESNSDDPIIGYFKGDLTVKTTKNGQDLIETYSFQESAELSVQSDRNTPIIIIGAVEASLDEYSNVIKSTIINTTNLLSFTLNGVPVIEKVHVERCSSIYLNLSYSYSLKEIVLLENDIESLECSECYNLSRLDISKNISIKSIYIDNCVNLKSIDLGSYDMLTELNCSNCYALTELNASNNITLTKLNCNSCFVLTVLDVSKNLALTQLNCGNCKKLISISYPAANESASISIASAIEDAASTTGTVYTDSSAAYYQTIADAATAKGWTIEQLPA